MKLSMLLALALFATACSGSDDPRTFPPPDNAQAAGEASTNGACAMSIAQVPPPAGYTDDPIEAWAFVHVEYLNRQCGTAAPTIVARCCGVQANWDEGFTALVQAPQPGTHLVSATSARGGGYAETLVNLE
jgi:hypothetical protein